MKCEFLKFDPFNFVPLTRTPWGGELIVKTKGKSLPIPQGGLPERVGESWEISTEASFPSRVQNIQTGTDEERFLSSILATDTEHFLGKKISEKYGHHCPLLLKWLNANDTLSVQVHPTHRHSALKSNECGKPESWLVLACENDGHVYLGFKENLSHLEIETALRNDRAADVLHIVYPKPGDYIAIPPGCVHATGPGVLIAEPQFVLPGRSGKTWRLSDWGRRYNQRGERDPSGQPRELHVDIALTAIDWTLPRGTELERLLVRNMNHSQKIQADRFNPFPVQYFSLAGRYTYAPLVTEQFSLVTCWQGQVQLISRQQEKVTLRAGESGLIAAAAGAIEIELSPSKDTLAPCCAFFGFVIPDL